jgi:hypothetical protein
MACLKVLLIHLPGDSEESHGKLSEVKLERDVYRTLN